MNILGRLALLFVVVPIVELMLLIELGQYIGLLPTVGLVMLTGVTGAWLARAEGLRVLFQFQKELASGSLPGQALLAGISVLIDTGQVRVVTMGGFGGGGFAGGGFGPGGFSGPGFDPGQEANTPRMDPSKGIVVEPEE